jgi:hypothetical protein
MGGVAAEFDLNLFPFYRIQGQETPQLPGLLVVKPPKRAAHGREGEALLVYLTLSGNTRFTTAEYDQIISQTTRRFFQTSGSLTFAIRTAAGVLNQSLVNRNLHTTGKGEYIVGRLILGVLRGGQFIFAQCGPTHVFQISGTETRQIHDEQIAGRGLGIGQATPLYFGQADLHNGDMLVLCPNLPAGWEETLLAEKNVSPETLSRTLLSLPSDDLNAVLVQAQPGKGNINILKEIKPGPEKSVPATAKVVPDASPISGESVASAIGKSAPVSSNSPIPVPAPGMPSSHVQSERPASRFTRLISNDTKSESSANLPNREVALQNAETSSTPAGQQPQDPAVLPVRHPGIVPVSASSHPLRKTGRFVSPRSTTDLPEIKRPRSRHGRKIFGGLARFIQGVRAGAQKLSDGIGKFLPNLMPGSNDDPEVAGSSMALFAIVIPVIIVAVAATVYIHYGRTEQYKQNYDMALAQAAQARGLTNPTDVRHAWDSTIYYLDLAEKDQKTQDSNTLRQEAQTALDNLDGIMRLDFRQAINGGLSHSVQVSHMAATDTDLYLLDAARGAVIRASTTDQGYEVDTSFKCDPGQYGSINVGALVGLEALPMSNFYNARVLAMDGKGNLLYCGLAAPVAVALVPPQLGWRSIAAFSLDSDGKNLYVLDPAGNAVWQYSGSFGQFPDLPVMFFGEQVPQGMNTAIDLAANAADLYMLFQDGHVTSCPMTRYDVVPMRCSDPATFVDKRPERQPGPKINDAIFTQMSFASAPDPSLYMLEPLTRAIYRFSPRADSLELRGQFRATMEQNNVLFDGSATAMTISPNRYAFFSVGNQVYFATDVP